MKLKNNLFKKCTKYIPFLDVHPQNFSMQELG